MPTTPETLLDLKQRYTIPCLYPFYRRPPVLVRGEMQYLYDATGRRYLDAYAGVTVMNAGHCNPAIIEPAITQIRALQHTTTIYLNEPLYRLAQALVDFLAGSLDRVFFVNSGSEANEGALLLSRLHTGKPGFIALNGALHGRTALTMGLTGLDLWRTDPFPPPHLYRAPRPHCAQCELGLEPATCGLACAEAVRALLREKGDVAALIAEPIQGNGGIVVPPAGYFERVRDILHEAGALLILDEVQCGFGRTGRRFAFQHTGIEPDILSVAKALGNGFPIGAFCTTAAIAASYTRPGASTTGGNPMCAAAALAVLRYHVDHDLADRAARLGAWLAARLAGLARGRPFIREVRGRGLMLGLELARGAEPLPALTDWLLEQMKDKGFLIGKTGRGRNVLTFMPPLVVTQDDLQALGTALEELLLQVQPDGGVPA
jgi:4-aminobutyrate aminotransferase/4-aminobutyrate aminotransferase/(S)-3-amino-2-methylpropionate transaminase